MKLPQFPSIPGLPREALKPVVALSAGLLAWIVVFSVWSGLSGLESSSLVQQQRLEDLLKVVRQYKSLPGRAEKTVVVDDPIVIVSSLVGTMGLKDNLVQISSLSKGLSVQLNRMYMEKAMDFIGELEKRGLVVDSAEIRAVPDGEKRLLSLALIVTVAS